jgi:cobaltochelatase CobT
LEHTMNTLTNALPIVAAAYGRKFSVPVQIGGDIAGTDGKTIHLPAIPDDPSTKTLAWGYLAHEAGHVRETDFNVWRSVAGQPLTQTITNILEDVRIENAMIASYPGTRQTLDAVLDWMIGARKIAAPRAEDQPPAVFANALLVLARHRYRKQLALTSLAQESERVLREVFPPTFVHRLLGLMTEIGSLQNTADAAALAQRMVDLIKDEAEKQPQPQPQDNQDQDQAEGDNNETQEQDGSSDDSPSDNQDKDASDGNRQSDSPSDSTDDSKDQGDESSGLDTDDGSESLEPCVDTSQAGRSALQSVLSADADDLPKDVFETVAEALGTQSHGQGVTLLPTLQDYAGHWQQGRQLLAQAKGHSAKLTTRLQGLVQAHTLTKTRTVRSGRTLSPTHLHRVAVGDSRIFVRKDERHAPNTAVHLLVDLSGSMAGGSDGIALEAAMALALALEPITGVSRAVTAFPGLEGSDGNVTRVLSHGDRVKSRAGAFVQMARGSTPMTGALWFAAADLIPRREQRKVLLTLTDGGPDDFGSAKEIVRKATAAGIEMIGVGIQQDVGRLFPVAIRIGSVADLKAELFRIAEQLLLS